MPVGTLIRAAVGDLMRVAVVPGRGSMVDSSVPIIVPRIPTKAPRCQLPALFFGHLFLS